jgi:hypothetical protein
MKKFEVSLVRSYIVSICAENKEQARKFSEFYLGNCPDLSKPTDRREYKFKIKDIEMTYNDAVEVKEMI